MPTLSPPLDPVKLWLAMLLRGAEPGAIPDASALLKVARAEGVLALCQYHLRRSPAWAQASAGLQAELTRCAHQEVAVELARTVELRAVLATLAQAGLPVLLLKGAALAHTLYPQPHLRSRSDTDLLLPSHADAERAGQVFQTLGYRCPATVVGDWANSELGCYKTSRGLTHALDVHWRWSNRTLFSTRVAFAELAAVAVPIPALGPEARGLGPVHALLLAGVHRASHRLTDPHSERLIWLYDIHRLAERLTAAEWQQLTALATTRALCGPCLAGLTTAQGWFGTRLPEESLNRLRAGAAGEAFDPGQPPQPWRLEWLEFRGLPSTATRLRWIGQRLFPDRAYLREQYGFHSALWLPWFYAVRIGRGILLRCTGQRPGAPARHQAERRTR